MSSLYFQLFTDIKNHLLGTIYYVEVLLITSHKIHRELEGYFSFFSNFLSTSQPCLPIPLPNSVFQLFKTPPKWPIHFLGNHLFLLDIHTHQYPHTLPHSDLIAITSSRDSSMSCIIGKFLIIYFTLGWINFLYIIA